MIAKIIEIFNYYKNQIREICGDIRTYWFLILLGTIILLSISYLIFYLLGGFVIDNLKLALSSMISLIASFTLNLYFSTVPKIRDCKKKKMKNLRRATNYFKNRHCNDLEIIKQVDNEYLKVTFDPPIE